LYRLGWDGMVNGGRHDGTRFTFVAGAGAKWLTGAGTINTGRDGTRWRILGRFRVWGVRHLCLDKDETKLN
jgi:hypothetical protein